MKDTTTTKKKKTFAELVKEHKQKRQNLAIELQSGMVTIDELKEVVSNLFRAAIVDEDSTTGEIIIRTGFSVTGVQEVPERQSLEDMRKEGDLKYIRSFMV